MTMVSRVQQGMNQFIRYFLLPLYGRKMLIFIFAVVAYLVGIPWEEMGQGVQYVVDNNIYFTDYMWFLGIAMVFVGGQAMDRFTDKLDNAVKRANEWPILKTLKAKTKEIFEPRAFLVWIVFAICFWFGVMTDEMLFYGSMAYVGVNSAEALITHVRTAKQNMTNVVQKLPEMMNMSDADNKVTEGNG